MISHTMPAAAFDEFSVKLSMQFSFSAPKIFIVSQLRGIGTHWKMLAYEGQYPKIEGTAEQAYQEGGNRMRRCHGHNTPDDDAMRSYRRNAQI